GNGHEYIHVSALRPGPLHANRGHVSGARSYAIALPIVGTRRQRAPHRDRLAHDRIARAQPRTGSALSAATFAVIAMFGSIHSNEAPVKTLIHSSLLTTLILA